MSQRTGYRNERAMAASVLLVLAVGGSHAGDNVGIGNPDMTAWEKRIYDDYMMQSTPANRAKEGRQRWRYVREFIPPNYDAAILDIGAGLGEMERMLRVRGYTNITSIDISEWQLVMAQQLENRVHKAEALAYMGKHCSQFDCILAMYIFEHLDKETVLKMTDAARYALKPGGVLIVQVPNACCVIADMFIADMTHQTNFSWWRFEQLQKLCGFASVECRECGIEPVGFWSLVRTALWIPIHALCMLCCLVMTGGTWGGIYTPCMVAALRKETDRAVNIGNPDSYRKT